MMQSRRSFATWLSLLFAFAMLFAARTAQADASDALGPHHHALTKITLPAAVGVAGAP